MKIGRVYLVGAGPGDPGLITVKGLECLRQADVIVYDRLVNKNLLAHAKAGAEMIFVGKGPKGHAIKQGEINALLVQKAKEGNDVVRLKGGDPFVYGRGGEEAEALVEAGVPFEVVPGVTSATAVPAYAGIPVTHRGLTSSLAIITGHEDPEKEGSLLPWDKVAGMGTIVFLMGMDNLSTIVEELIKHGRPSSSPIALIRWGATPQQQTLEGTLADIVKKADEVGFAPPVVGVVGDVVKLREKLRWYDNKPLFGKRVLVTRSRKQASALSALLAQEGAEPVELPTIEIKAIEENLPLREAIGHIDKYHWLIFTSVNGVEAFFKALKDTGKDVRALARVRTCAIGPATADAIKDQGLGVDLMPEDYLAEGILQAFGKKEIKGTRFLLPRAEGAREALAEGLRKLGAEVEEVSAYRAVSPRQSRDAPLKMLLRGEIDIVTFTSSSTASNLAQMLNGRLEALEKPLIACIGPITASTVQKLGLRVDVTASKHTVPGLVKALKEAVSANG